MLWWSIIEQFLYNIWTLSYKIKDRIATQKAGYGTRFHAQVYFSGYMLQWGKWRPLPPLLSLNFVYIAAAKSYEKLNRMLESGVWGQCERITYSWTLMFRSVRNRYAYKFVRSRQKLEKGAAGTIPEVKWRRTGRFVSCYRNMIPLLFTSRYN